MGWSHLLRLDFLTNPPEFRATAYVFHAFARQISAAQEQMLQ